MKKLLGYTLSAFVGFWAYNQWSVGNESPVIGWITFWIAKIYWESID